MGTRPSEFDLIHRFFSLGVTSHWPSQGIGDDCALLKVGDTTLAITTDTTALGTHFLPDANPQTVGFKALAVNLSDLAAAGATPRAFFLAISLPEANEAWLKGFSEGLKKAAQTYQCALLGGDTTKSTTVGETRSPATFTITALGEAEHNAVTRAGASVGDDIWVSGTVGDAYAALMMRTKVWPETVTEYLESRMDCPTPRVALGCELLAHVASAAADVSDGLYQDLGHILERSKVGAKLWVDRPALSSDLAKMDTDRRRQAQWAGGDDYELVFTASPKHRQSILKWSETHQLPLSRIGCVIEEGVYFENDKNEVVNVQFAGFDHFRE